MRRVVSYTILVFAGLLLVSAVASAQGTSTGAIAGTAKDASGAVLPGVTVEASSPALIEKSRTTVTDDNGEYKIIELRPGTYTVTFTLPGFNTFKRDGLELRAEFHRDDQRRARGRRHSGNHHRLGQHAARRHAERVAAADVLERAARRRADGEEHAGHRSLMPSVVQPPNAQDVGGSKGERSVRLSVHGSKTYDSRLLQDGMRYNALTPGIGPPVAPATLFVPSLEGTGRGYYINPLAAEETLIDTGSLGSAQYEYGGAQVNMIPKDGGNAFSGSVFFAGTGSGLQSNNLTSELQSEGLTSVNSVRKVYDFNGAFGGPIMKDRVWFFGSARGWGTTTGVANLYADANISARVRRRAGRRVAVRAGPQQPDLPGGSRPRRRYPLHGEAEPEGQVHGLVRSAAELPGSADRPARNRHDQERGERRLLPAAVGPARDLDPARSRRNSCSTRARPSAKFNFGGFGGDLFLSDYESCGGGMVNNVSINDTSLGYTYNGVGNRNMALSHQTNGRFNVSYVTGAHSLKTGVFWMYGLNGGHGTYFDRAPGQVNGLPVSYSFNNGAPRLADAVRGADVHARSAESGSRPLRPGPVAGGTLHDQRRASARLGPRIGAGDQRAGGSARAGAQLRCRRQRAELERSQPAVRHRVGSVRRRQDRDQGRHQPLRPLQHDRDRELLRSGQCVGEQHDAFVDRQQRQLPARLQSQADDGQRRVRRDGERELRRAGRDQHAGPGLGDRLGQAAVHVADRASRSIAKSRRKSR